LLYKTNESFKIIYNYFSLNNKFSLPKVSTFQICIAREDKLIISLANNDHIIFYEYKEDKSDINDTVKYMFEEIQNITFTGIRNVMPFESGTLYYLAATGSRSNLFKFDINQHVYTKIMDNFFHGNNY
jgi:hypothetical protein